MYNAYYFGGYLIFTRGPEHKVFIDGRSDFYGTPFELKYLDVLSAKYDWDQNLDRYGAQTVLVPADAALASALKENPPLISCTARSSGR